MGWMREAIKKKFFGQPKPEKVERVDNDLPLDLRIGMRVKADLLQLQLGEHIVQEPQGYTMKTPQGFMTVVAWGKVSYMGYDIHHFDCVDEEDADFTLQIFTKDGDIDTIRLYDLQDELTPETWNDWLNEERGLIGIDPLVAPDGAEWTRMWEGDQIVELEDGITRTTPISWKEIRYVDPTGDPEDIITHECMLYGRSVVNRPMLEPDEFLFVSAATQGNESCVQILVGVIVDKIDLEITW
jgi:hypothetical protein